MKKVLIIYFTQSGQLRDIAKNIAQPLEMVDDISVDWLEIKTKKPYPFPWDHKSFFDVFPETFQMIPQEIEEIDAKYLDVNYDLILLHYQVWYLSPSLPITSFLKSAFAKRILENKKVVTINGSRNMWLMAQEKMKKLLALNSAALVGNIALVDRAPNLISVMTIVHWMFSGKKTKYLGFFPLPGVSEQDIENSKCFGKVIEESLLEDNYNELQQNLVNLGAVNYSSYLAKVDRTANKIFEKWSTFIISKKESRQGWLKVFYVYLFLAIWLISPIVYILHVLTYPINLQKIQRERQYFKGVQLKKNI